ncbi:MAG: NnrU family protein [Pseudomonadota bacterium]
MEWIGFFLAFVVFFLTHSVPVRPPVRPALVRRLGPRGFTMAYSALSLAVLAWLIVAAARAPYVPLWPWAIWQNHAALALMCAACVIVGLAIGRPNPFSFGGARNELFDTGRPGIVRLTRHPLLIALALWSGAHLLANGDLAHLLLFGTFGVFAVMGTRLVDRRKRSDLGPAWADLWGEVTRVHRTDAIRTILSEEKGRVLAGLVLFAGLFLLHPVVIGVNPLP